MIDDRASAPLRVLFTIPFAERLGGAENTLWSFLERVDRSRIEPAVLFFADGPFEREVAGLGIPTTVVSTGRFRELHTGARAVFEIARLLRRTRPDLIVNWLTRAQIYVAPAAAFAGLAGRVVWWQHLRPGRDWMERAAALLPARAIGTHARNVAEAQSHVHPRRRTVVVAPAVAPLAAIPEVERAALRERLGLPADTPVLGIVGRLQRIKGQDRFIRALAALEERGHPVRGLVVGGDAHGLDAPFAQELRALTRELGLEEAVTFTGQVDDVGPYLQVCDIAVNACAREGFGLVVVEAMSLGICAVAIDAAGPAEIIEPGESGLLSPSDSPDDLAETIAPLLDDPVRRERLGAGGRARYASAFRPDRAAAELQRCLEALAAEVRSGARGN